MPRKEMPMTYKDFRNLPGPGDPETWGPCLNHPNDPRTPDWSGEIEERKEEIYLNRLQDLDGYFIEIFTEAAESDLRGLAEAVADADAQAIATAVLAMARKYCEPSDEETREEIDNDKYWGRYED